MAKSRPGKRRRPDGAEGEGLPSSQKASGKNAAAPQKRARVVEDDGGSDADDSEPDMVMHDANGATASATTGGHATHQVVAGAGSKAVAGQKPSMLTLKEFIAGLASTQHDVVVSGMDPHFTTSSVF